MNYNLVFRQTKKNAAKRGIPFEIDQVFFFSLLKRQDHRCAVSGIEFTDDKPAGSTRRPYAPSIDRIDSSIGYTEQNTRVVCTAVNYAMNEWGDGVFNAIVNHSAAKTVAPITDSLMESLEARITDVIEKRLSSILKQASQPKPVIPPAEVTPTTEPTTEPTATIANGDRSGFSVDEVAQMYGLSRQKVYDEINAGRLHSMKVGKRRMLTQSHLERWESTCEAA